MISMPQPTEGFAATNFGFGLNEWLLQAAQLIICSIFEQCDGKEQDQQAVAYAEKCAVDTLHDRPYSTTLEGFRTGGSQ